MKTSKVLAGEAHGNGKTSTAKHLRREMPFAYSWALNKAEFCASLTPELTGAARFFAQRPAREAREVELNVRHIIKPRAATLQEQ